MRREEQCKQINSPENQYLRSKLCTSGSSSNTLILTPNLCDSEQSAPEFFELLQSKRYRKLFDSDKYFSVFAPKKIMRCKIWRGITKFMLPLSEHLPRERDREVNFRKWKKANPTFGKCCFDRFMKFIGLNLRTCRSQYSTSMPVISNQWFQTKSYRRFYWFHSKVLIYRFDCKQKSHFEFLIRRWSFVFFAPFWLFNSWNILQTVSTFTSCILVSTNLSELTSIIHLISIDSWELTQSRPYWWTYFENSWVLRTLQSSIFVILNRQTIIGLGQPQCFLYLESIDSVWIVIWRNWLHLLLKQTQTFH